MSMDREPGTIDLVALLSEERLRPFADEARSRGASTENVYVWNQALAAAFLGPLGMVEVALRNGFDARLSAHFALSGTMTPPFMRSMSRSALRATSRTKS